MFFYTHHTFFCKFHILCTSQPAKIWCHTSVQARSTLFDFPPFWTALYYPLTTCARIYHLILINFQQALMNVSRYNFLCNSITLMSKAILPDCYSATFQNKAMPPTSTSDVVSKHDKTRYITFGATFLLVLFNLEMKYIQMIDWNLLPIYGGARGVVVIVVGNGHGDTNSNPGRDWLHFT